MSEYLPEKYATFVNARMVKELFSTLTKHLGDNTSKAAEECDLTRKTVYDWDNSKEEVKMSTKVKVLETLIEKLPAETLLYLTQQLRDAGADVLMSYLSTLYEKTFDAENNEDAGRQLKEFEKATKMFAGVIYQKLDTETNNLTRQLSIFAGSKNIQWTPKPIKLYDYDTLNEIIPRIINSWVYFGLPQSPEELSSRLKVPLEITEIVGKTLNEQFLPIQQKSLHDRGTTSGTEDFEESQGVEVGYYIYGNSRLMMGTAGIPLKNRNRSENDDPLAIGQQQSWA